MARGHSRRVQMLKLALPLAALAVLATMFVFLRNAPVGPPATGGMRLTEGQTDGILMTLPTFAGVGANGTRVTARAASARPGVDGTDLITAQEADLTLDLREDQRITARAPRLILDLPAELLVLEGGAVVRDQTGWVARMPILRVATDGSRAEGTGPVIATGPGGDIEAGGMVIERIPGSADYSLVFNKGTRLIYLGPEATSDAPKSASGPSARPPVQDPTR